MKLYLDTADTRLWQVPAGCPPIQGVTTNPTLVQQAGLPVTLASYRHLVSRAGEWRLPELMLQLPRADVAEAHDWIAELLPAAGQAQVRLTLKLPCHPDWAPVIREVRAWGLPVLLTGLANPLQLLWAQAQGAQFVAPYLGRLADDGRDVWTLVEACVTLQKEGLNLLAASIRSAEVFCRLIALGASAATVRPEFVVSLIHDPLTMAAMAEFDANVERSLLQPSV
ncbi:MAG: transaldolase family protein [Methylococcus sp.]